jgi:hypothetical protein
MQARQDASLPASEVQYGQQIAMMDDVVDAMAQFSAASHDVPSQDELRPHGTRSQASK